MKLASSKFSSLKAVEVRDQLNSLQEDHTDSLRKLGLLQREIDEAAVSNPSLEFSASNPNVRLQRVEDDDEGRDRLLWIINETQYSWNILSDVFIV